MSQGNPELEGDNRRDVMLQAAELFMDGKPDNAKRYLAGNEMTSDVLDDPTIMAELRSRLGEARADFFSMLYDVSESVERTRAAAKRESATRDATATAKAQERAAERPVVREDEIGPELKSSIDAVLDLIADQSIPQNQMGARFKQLSNKNPGVYAALGAMQRPGVLEAMKMEPANIKNVREWARWLQAS